MNISALVGFNCARLAKIAAHEMGHALGLKHPDIATFVSAMRGVNPDSRTPTQPWGDADLLPDQPGCGDDQGIIEAARFEAPGPAGPSGDYGGPVGCGQGGDYYTDSSTCCHIAALVWAPAVGHVNRLPVAHIVSPANNSSFIAGATVSVNVHTMDLDGSVERLDYIVKPLGGSQFTISGGGYPFSLNAQLPPGVYDIEAVAYDTADQYSISAPVRLTVSPLPGAAQVLASGGILYAGQYRTSANGSYTLLYQGDGNLVLYGPGGAIIATMTFGSPGGTYMNPTGNLEVYNAGPVLVWQSLTAGAGNANSYVWVTDYGKVALVRPNGTMVGQWP